MAWMLSWVGGPVQGRIAHWSLLLPEIEKHEAGYLHKSDYELRKISLSLKYRAKAGEPLERLLPEAFALCREAGRRKLNMRHFEVQLLGGIGLFRRSIVEMETGEGKTLTATLPLYLYSLAGKGAHLATVNDYLAKRDAEWMKPLYDLLGVSVGIIQSEMSQEDRRTNYACDITYGTAKEFGFDFLRDRLLLRALGMEQSVLYGGSTGQFPEGADKPVQRESYFALVDEADSILIDEARTPLIIGTLGDESRRKMIACYEWAAKMAKNFKEFDHYEYDHEFKYVELTADGRQLARGLPKPDEVRSLGLIEIYEFLERAIKVERDYLKDVQYVVRDGEIVIVDEFTGRLGEGRKWRDGIHQAVEAKEGVEVGLETGQAARITVQDLFLRYEHLAGMTGTAASASSEMASVYDCAVVPVPTNRPSGRKKLEDRVFGTSTAKFAAVVQEVKAMHQLGRPVLLGTRSIDKSELLSWMLKEEGIEHVVLNAHKIAEEAAIVAEAGKSGKVMVATNMAGRGTDIKLEPEVAALGGLHVICTEVHESARIDRQLIGRCGRQGDPGTYRQYMSLDDEIIEKGFDPDYAEQLIMQGAENPAGDFNSMAYLFYKGQANVEAKHFRDRSTLLYHEKQRKKMQIAMGQDPYLDSPH
jgi:preprotein translocase subunit SecA